MRILVIFAFLIITSCYQTERHCEDFKTGKFYSEVNINGEVFKSSFKRTQSLQTETYNNKTDSSKLRWINDCEVVFKDH